MRRRALLGAALLAGGCSPTDIANLATPRRGTMRVEGLRYGPLPRHRLDLVLPPMPVPATPLLVFIHGGGWETGGRGQYAFLARRLASLGFAVAVPDYRLWPEARWPDFIEDAARAVAWLRAAGGVVPGGPLFVMGHSAGGFIAAALALDPRWLASAGLPGGRGALAGAVLISAPISWQPTDEPVVSIFAGAPGGRIEAAPDAAMLAAAPPTLLLHGTADTVVGPVHAVELAAALESAGRPVRLRLYEGVGHIGIMSDFVPGARLLGLSTAPVVAEVRDFVKGSSSA
ncbi:alpha/beta hydrolase [Falsiroseomonas selenitidurans]|uniref:Alpha/beta hydrolase n=1 Tax=Falsiroseomonas selenitidurans TaxID=2716335 RepID=A0ABX1EFK4_9PROT|nr:alpha/beta hydrolase [Falsiroseomonas selenitidurans]NKC34312.1 alpha/beta hydrolase [Falsiroseomonas selenitidurans]